MEEGKLQRDLADIVLKWPIKDVLNKNLFKGKVCEFFQNFTNKSPFALCEDQKYPQTSISTKKEGLEWRYLCSSIHVKYDHILSYTDKLQ